MASPSYVRIIEFIVTLIFGFGVALFVWISWKRLTEYIGDSILIWAIAGIVVLLGLVIGKVSVSKILRKLGL